MVTIVVEFIPGVKLNESFYNDVVRNLIEDSFPDLQYSIGRLGKGSDVLGYDTEMSTDHDWGVRLELFLKESDFVKYSDVVSKVLSERLPSCFQGYSTHFTRASPTDSWVMHPHTDGPINHRIEFYTIRSFFERRIGFNPHETPTPADWLVFTDQGLLEVIGGKVFHDGLEQLQKTREKFRYYPEDVWRYLLAAQWARIGQEDHLMGRAGYIGDEIGARIMVSRLVRDIMRLCFLTEKKYAPYQKWFGTAFMRLGASEELHPLLLDTLEAKDWKTRDKAFSAVCEIAARHHNDLKITEPLEEHTRSFHNRPFSIIDAGRFMSAIRDTISDKEVLNLPKFIGSIDQFSDSTDLIAYPKLKQRVKNVYHQQTQIHSE